MGNPFAPTLKMTFEARPIKGEGVLDFCASAIKTGEAFVGRYYGFKRPLEAKEEGGTWLVVFDGGILKVERVELRIHSDSGSKIEYKVPENP